MARVVFVTSPMNWGRRRDRLWEVLAGLAYAGAVVGAASTGWARGGLLEAIGFGFVAIFTFPCILGVGTLLFSALYPVLMIPGTLLAAQLGWTGDSLYDPRRRWLERISALLILLPIAIVLQRNAWVVFNFLASVALLGFVLFFLLIMVPILIVISGFLYAMSRDHQSRDDQVGEVASNFRWTKVDLPRLPPPSDDE